MIHPAQIATVSRPSVAIAKGWKLVALALVPWAILIMLASTGWSSLRAAFGL